MELISVKEADYARLMSFYYDVIENTSHMPKYGRWKKGLHPKEEAILAFIKENAMYMLTEGGEIAGAMALTMYEGEDYRDVAWGVKASGREVAVIHLLAVSPAFQWKGVGKRLIDESIRLASERGKKAVRLDALATNLPAQRMYEGKGFIYRGKQNLFAENTGFTDFFYYEYALGGGDEGRAGE